MQKRISQTFVWNGLKVLVVVFLGFVGVLRADVLDDAQEIVEYFYTLNAEEANPHKKINHAKGFCAIGEFIPNKEVAKDFAIPLLHNKSEVKVRFSLAGGNLKQSDKSKNRSLALKIQGKNDSWEMAMTNARINFATNASEFKQFMRLQVQQKEGKITQDEADKQRAKVRSFANFAKEAQSLPITPSFANSAYHSVHTFGFLQSNGDLLLARFSFIPKAGIKGLSKEELDGLNDEFLESAFKKALSKAPVEFDLTLVVPNKNDKIKDTAQVWEGARENIVLGTLKVSKFDGYGCNGEVFMPSNLPQGIQAPNDDIFELRNLVYALSASKR